MPIIDIIVILLIILCLDAVYLSILRHYLDRLTGQVFEPKWHIGIFIYIMLAVGIYYLIIYENKPVEYAAVLGFFTYAIYELTNYATLKGWTLEMVLIDTTWGSFLFATTTYAYRMIML